MRSKAWGLVLALLLTSTALSGCLDTAPLLVVGRDGQITAKQAANHGADEARAWQDDARLVSMGALESTLPKEPWFQGNGSTWNMSRDPDVGDGEAPAWGLSYLSRDANEQLSFVVWANGNVTHRETHPLEPHDDDEPLQAWNLDSDDALDAARDNATFRGIEEDMGKERTYMLALFQEDAEDRNDTDDHRWDQSDKGTTWLVMIWGGGSTGGMAFVDATDGDVLWAMDWARFGGWAGWGSWGAGWGSGGGNVDDDAGPRTTHQACYDDRVSGDTPKRTYDLPVHHGATHARVGLEATKDLVTDGFTLEVRSEDGEQVTSFESSPGSGTSQSFTWSESLDPGNYTVVMRLHDASVGVDYTLGTWAGVPGEDDDHGYGDWDDYGWDRDEEEPCHAGA